MGKIEYVKLDADDIMEILLEHYQDNFPNSEYAKGMFLGTPDRELRFVAAFGCADDEQIRNIDLKEVDKKMEYNGDHAFLKNNPDFFVK